MKEFVEDRNLSIQYLNRSESYLLYAYDGYFALETDLLKDPSDTTDLNDFINNYKIYANQKIASNTIPSRLMFDERFYKRVPAYSELISPGVIVPNNEEWGFYHFRANGSDPNCYVVLAFDYGNAGEDIFASTKGDILIHNDTFCDCNIITGDGVKKLQIVLINNGSTLSPYIGGYVELVKAKVKHDD
jgi:hypothetical protein